PDYAESGLATVFRDRGKRFATAFSADVTPERIAQVRARRDEIYAGTPAEIVTANGSRHQMYIGQPDGGRHAFVFDLGYAGARVTPGTMTGPADATAVRDLLVAPIAGQRVSVLDLGKLAADGEPEGAAAPYGAVPGNLPGVVFTLPQGAANGNGENQRARY
ncbi:MAG: hypothetical protein LPL00_05685, partial [Alphaproteobacteria bacterium]|nr:hypothetical protein [Alphaproteobacteria bacterium]MDX5369030.1 hypothetical protein [Alphaproteobacteria bacterium]MDX5463733.1 hypothetical protein [Alphaproteobacteria bacterium]